MFCLATLLERRFCTEVCCKYLEKFHRKLPVKGKRWLDLGAGCGLLGMLLSHLGAEYVLVTDIAEVFSVFCLLFRVHLFLKLSC